MRKVPQVGDYVLATKYKDGDSGDHWAIGFYSGLTGGPGRYGEDPRYDVIDGIGKSFRGNGFRRVEVIAREEGDYLLKNSRDIETSRCNVWGVLKRFRMAKNKSAES